MDENEEKLKSQLMKIEKEILINYLVGVNKYIKPALFWTELIEEFWESTKHRQRGRKLDRILQQIESGNYSEKRKKRVRKSKC